MRNRENNTSKEEKVAGKERGKKENGKKERKGKTDLPKTGHEHAHGSHNVPNSQLPEKKGWDMCEAEASLRTVQTHVPAPPLAGNSVSLEFRRSRRPCALSWGRKRTCKEPPSWEEPFNRQAADTPHAQPSQ